MGLLLVLIGIVNQAWTEERSGTEQHPVMSFENLASNDTSISLDVLHYRLTLDIDIPAETLSGQTQITFEMLEPSDSIKLDLVGLTVSTVLEGATPRIFNRRDSSLIVNLGRTVNPGSAVTLSILYHGKPTLASGGFGRGMYINPGDEEVTYTCNAPWGAKYWFCCQDNPADKATMEMTVTVPSEYEVISNGKLISAARTGPSWTFTWNESHPIATYLIALAASRNYSLTVDTATVEGTPVPIYHWVLKADSAEITPKLVVVSQIMEYFSELFYPYPFRDEKYAHVDAPVPGAMENQTCTHINTSVDWGDWDVVVAHEFSHSWWGDATTCRLLKHMWLNEGFATYCAALWIEHRDGQAAYQDYYEKKIRDPYLKQYNLQRYPILDPPWQYIYSVLTYEKSAAVLHMLRRLVGDEDFFTILRTYGLRYQDSTALSEEFESIVNEVTGEDHTWFFDQWLRKTGHPEYAFDWSAQPVDDSLLLGIILTQTQTWPPDAPVFRMPVELGLVAGSDTSFVWFTDSLKTQEFELKIPGALDNVIFDPHGNILCKYTTSGVEESEPQAGLELVCSAICRGQLDYQIAGASGSFFDIALYDASGRMASCWHGLSPRGSLNLDYLPRGVYFIKLLTLHAQSRTIILLR